MRRGRFFKR
jgi:hypothetical protein